MYNLISSKITKVFHCHILPHNFIRAKLSIRPDEQSPYRNYLPYFLLYFMKSRLKSRFFSAASSSK